MALNLANVQTSDTFQTWFTRTNQIIRDSFPATGGTVSGNVTANFITVGNISGNVSANFITGDGSGITGVGITTASDAVANRNLRLLFTGTSSGTTTSANVNPTLTFNPSTGTLAANVFSGSFTGSGSGLTGVGITTASDTVASRNLLIPFTGISSGSMTSANVNPTFTFNPATGTVAANNFVGDGAQLTNTETTVAVNGGANSSLSVLFTGITAGQLTSANTHTALLYNPSIGTLFATDFDSTSDERLKKNIKPIEGALNKVSKLVGVEFDWVNTDKKSIGVIAQQVEEVVPELVHTNSKGYKSVSYGNLVALLIEAIKELSENTKTGNNQ